jgi:hypothetical protein
MRAWDNPIDPDRQPPEIPGDGDDDQPPDDREPEGRRRIEPDPEAQRAPGAEDDAGGSPPMQA